MFYLHVSPKFETETSCDLEWHDTKNNLILNARIYLKKKMLKSNLYVYFFPEESHGNNICRIYTKKEKNGGEVHNGNLNFRE